MNIAILITHGTDTLAWTHAFIRYALKNNRVNIAITGSQVPLPTLPSFSDAYINIVNSVHFLRNIKPAHIFTVFNNGTQAFSDSLYKVDRWNHNAFTGDMIARMEWDEVKFADKRVAIYDSPIILDKLYLLTTGGTIASSNDINDSLSPKKSPLLEEFIKVQHKDSIVSIEEHSTLVIDSSDITLTKMKAITDKIIECVHENGYTETFADTSFDKHVRIIYTDPFKTIEDYRREVQGASAVILAGYGGGNINIEKDDSYSPISLIEELREKNIPVVLSSQVALGPADFIYGNGRKAIDAGAISGVDLSLPEIQMRLAYILGHKEALESFTESANMNYLTTLEKLFVSGMKFRTRKSLEVYSKVKNLTPSTDDLLINRTFEEALEEVR
ncbi:MAG: asparaginase domain-containing protein [Rikenellaceae bacterium]